MHPVLCNIFGMNVFSYGFFMACGFFLATISAVEAGKRYNIKKDDILDLAIWILMSGIVGARVLYLIINYQYYISHPLEIFMLNKGGLVYYGGIIAGSIAFITYINKKKLPLLIIGDIILAVLPIGQMFGRFGCFMNGCCFGTHTLLPYRVIFPVNSPAFLFYGEFTPVHPVQLYESIGTGIIFLILISLLDHKKYDGQIIIGYGLLYSVLRFFLEFIRGDRLLVGFGLSLSQYISILLFSASVLLFFYLKNKNKTQSSVLKLQ